MSHRSLHNVYEAFKRSRAGQFEPRRTYFLEKPIMMPSAHARNYNGRGDRHLLISVSPDPAPRMIAARARSPEVSGYC